MSWGQYLFGFSGRINRARYWLFILAGLLFYAAGFAIALPYILLEHRTTTDAGHALSPLGIVTICGEAVVVIAFLVSVFAIYVKRLHDRNKSAWWIIPFFLVPVIINLTIGSHLPTHVAMLATENLLLALVSIGLSLWSFVEVGCLRGTRGSNRFGEDPLST